MGDYTLFLDDICAAGLVCIPSNAYHIGCIMTDMEGQDDE